MCCLSLLVCSNRSTISFLMLWGCGWGGVGGGDVVKAGGVEEGGWEGSNRLHIA